MQKDALRRLFQAAVFLTLAVLACGPEDVEENGLSVTITRPPTGTVVTLGEEVPIASTALADLGVARVELSVNGRVVRTDEPPEEAPTVFSVIQPWVPDERGEIIVSVVVFDTAGAASEPATVALRVVAEEGEVTPAAVVTPTPVEGVEGPGGCTLNASYVMDVTIPDDTEMPPGESFVKTWRIRNSGDCNWGAGFRLVYVSGDQMGGPDSVAAPATAAGSTADLNVPLTAPNAPGTYRGNWQMRSDEGVAFGHTVYVRIIVPAPATEAPTALPPTAPPPTAPPPTAPPPTTEPLQAPTTLMKSVLPSGFVSLVWVDNSTGEDGFHILADGAIFDTVGPNAGGGGFHYGDHFCDQTVDLTVVAYRGAETSAPSNSVSHTGPPCAPPVVVEASGVAMALASYLDLDTGALGAFDANVDLLWQSSGGYRVIGMNGMRFANVGVGPSRPSYVGCSSASKTESAIYTPQLQAGSRLCFTTTEGNLAGFRVQEIQADHTLVISYVTWDESP